MNPSTLADNRPPAVLVVEDELPLLCRLVGGLESLGLRALPASSPAQAIEVLQAEAESVAFALIDRTLPGLDGFQTMLALRAIKPCLRCCILTGEVKLDREELWLVPGLSFLGKPFNRESLAVCVRQLLDEAVSVEAGR